MDEIVVSEQFLVQLTAHQRRLLRYIQTLTPNRSDAEDLLQETNLYLCRHAQTFQPGSEFAAWALRVAYFRVLEWRARQPRGRLALDDEALEKVAAAAAQTADPQAERRRDALENCLQKLRPADRRLIAEFYGDRRVSGEELAQRIGRSLNGLYVSLHRARLKLMECVRRTLAAEERRP